MYIIHGYDISYTTTRYIVHKHNISNIYKNYHICVQYISNLFYWLRHIIHMCNIYNAHDIKYDISYKCTIFQYYVWYVAYTYEMSCTYTKYQMCTICHTLIVLSLIYRICVRYIIYEIIYNTLVRNVVLICEISYKCTIFYTHILLGTTYHDNNIISLHMYNISYISLIYCT
jgi:hypothetical protein